MASYSQGVLHRHGQHTALVKAAVMLHRRSSIRDVIVGELRAARLTSAKIGEQMLALK